MDESGMCLYCKMQLHDECTAFNYAENRCCCPTIGKLNNDPEQKTGERDGMAWSKDDETIQDSKSTGRKRAAIIYPIEKESACEWQGLKYAGGGAFPIYGCEDGKQIHRHHGPDLSTLNNTEGNVHRICTDCHNIWHTNNNGFIKVLDASVVWAKHDAKTKYIMDELLQIKIQGRAVASRERFTWHSYNKEKDNYQDYIQNKEGSGMA